MSKFKAGDNVIIDVAFRPYGRMRGTVKSFKNDSFGGTASVALGNGTIIEVPAEYLSIPKQDTTTDEEFYKRIKDEKDMIEKAFQIAKTHGFRSFGRGKFCADFKVDDEARAYARRENAGDSTNIKGAFAYRHYLEKVAKKIADEIQRRLGLKAQYSPDGNVFVDYKLRTVNSCRNSVVANAMARMAKDAKGHYIFPHDFAILKKESSTLRDLAPHYRVIDIADDGIVKLEKYGTVKGSDIIVTNAAYSKTLEYIMSSVKPYMDKRIKGDMSWKYPMLVITVLRKVCDKAVMSAGRYDNGRPRHRIYDINCEKDGWKFSGNLIITGLLHRDDPDDVSTFDEYDMTLSLMNVGKVLNKMRVAGANEWVTLASSNPIIANAVARMAMNWNYRNNYQFFVVREPIGSHCIMAGNEFREDAKEAQNDLPPSWGKGKIVTRTYLTRMGVDPNDAKSWYAESHATPNAASPSDPVENAVRQSVKNSLSRILSEIAKLNEFIHGSSSKILKQVLSDATVDELASIFSPDNQRFIRGILKNL